MTQAKRAALLVVNATIPPSFLQKIWQRFDLHIACNGGINQIPAGLAVDVAIGDFDSANLDDAQAANHVKNLVALCDQNVTDVEKALTYSLHRGCSHIAIVGLAGSETHHMLNSIVVLQAYQQYFTQVVCGDDTQTWCIHSSIKQPFAVECKVSFFALHGETVISNAAGLRWQLPIGVTVSGAVSISNIVNNQLEIAADKPLTLWLQTPLDTMLEAQ